MCVFLEKTIYSLLQVHFPRNLILDSESSVNFTETPTLKFFTTFFFRKYYRWKMQWRNVHSGLNGLNYKDSHCILAVFHILSGYDAHFIIKETTYDGRVELLPITKEKYISFTKNV